MSATFEQRAIAAEQALLALVPLAGSEAFVRDGDGFRADVPWLLKTLQERHEDSHGRLVKAITSRNAAVRFIREITPVLVDLYGTDHPRVAEAKELGAEPSALSRQGRAA